MVYLTCKMNTQPGFYTVSQKSTCLLSEDWDYIIILDACRFDFFNEIYSKYLGGNARKAVSPATTTMQWLNIVFPDYYDDVIYISSNPYVNSKVNVSDQYGHSFDGKKHFHKVLDVWDWGWDGKLGTVLPETVNKAFLDVKDKYPGRRFVLHYMQPHEPYVGPVYSKYLDRVAFEKVRKAGQSRKNRGFLFKARRFFVKKYVDSFGVESLWSLKKMFRFSNVSQTTLIGMNEGMVGVRKAYLENLNLVLEQVKDVVKHMDGNILVTGDHGEYLGEKGRFGHGLVERHPAITDVPWLEIGGWKKSGGKISEHQNIRRTFNNPLLLGGL